MPLPAIIEPIPLPDLARPEQMSLLPQWVVSRVEALEEFEGRPALPESLIPNVGERAMIAQAVSGLTAMAKPCPQNSEAEARAMTVIVTKMLLALGGAATTEAAAEAKGEAYMIALADLPSWAVKAARDRWYRRDCGEGNNYAFPPDPAKLRYVADIEARKVSCRIGALTKLLEAKPIKVVSEEDRARVASVLADVSRKLSAGTDKMVNQRGMASVGGYGARVLADLARKQAGEAAE